MPQVTLVAHYGPKSTVKQARFAAYVRACQVVVLDSPLGTYFSPYAPEQLHGTIVGLEALETTPGAARSKRRNANIWSQRGELRTMNFECVLARARSMPPLSIRFGAFQPNDKTIKSMGADAYTRSFQVQWRRGKVVIVGWHQETGKFGHHEKLWAYRHGFAASCGVAHKYQDDSDFFVTIGDLQIPEQLPGQMRAELVTAGSKLETELRQTLANCGQAVDLPVRSEHLSVVRYNAASLDPGTSEPYSLTDSRLDAHFLAGLYT